MSTTKRKVPYKTQQPYVAYQIKEFTLNTYLRNTGANSKSEELS